MKENKNENTQKKSIKNLNLPTILSIIAISLAAVSLILAIFALVLGGDDDAPLGLQFFPDGEGNYIVAAGEAKYLSEIVIPETYKGGRVVGIDKKGFADCENLTSITIPDSVVSIGDYAFDQCDMLSCVNIGSGVLKIGLHAFSGCTALTEITLPEGVLSIGEYAFYNCSSLADISIPDSVNSIGAYAFSGCDGLGYCKYDNAYYLGSVGNPYHTLVKPVGTDITNIEINPNTKIICSSAFSYCYSLTEVDIPEGVTEIGVEAFYECTSLKYLVLPSTVNTVWSRAFYGCTALTDIYFTGSETRLYAITIYSDNDPFYDADLYYNYSRTN